MTKTEKLKHCTGCKDNFYNGGNPYGIRECMHLESAKLILRKEVPVTRRPPWGQAARHFLSCYRRKGYVYMDGAKRR